MYNSTLKISDGTTTIDLLNIDGWLLKNWNPSVPEPKGGGNFRSSPLTDGRKLASRRIDNVFDTFNLVVSGANQNNTIQAIQELQRLLEKATSYWTADYQNEPVWIEARASCESEVRYATIVDFRLTGFGGPFEQPFFNAANMVASEASLTTEHLPWQETQPGDDGECVKVSSQYDLQNSVSGDTYTVDAQYDDTTIVSSPWQALWYLNRLWVGDVPWTNEEFPYGYCMVAMRFIDIAIPNGSVIYRATLTMTASDTLGSSSLDTYVRAESPVVGGSPNFDQTYAAINARDWNLSGASALFTFPAATADVAYSTDVTNIIQEIVDDANWANGDDLALRLYGSTIPGGGYRKFYSSTGLTPPTLYIEYSAGVEPVGSDPTCSNLVYVCNKHNKAPITHAYYYDASGPSFSDQMIGDALPISLLPAVPASGDIIYFGSATSQLDTGPFTNIIFDIGTPASVGMTGYWKYYDGATWDNLDTTGYGGEVCGNTQLREDGISEVIFVAPEDWAVTTINGIEAYWVQYVLAGAVAPAVPTQQNGDIYTAILPYVEIDSSEVGGDIPALARILFDSASCSARRTSTLVAGLRSIDRGEDFSAYLNASDEQNPYGVVFYPYVTSSAALAVASEAPTGINLTVTAANTSLTDVCSWILDATISNQYLGTYHAFVRVRQVTGTEGNVSFRLKSVLGSGYNVNYSDVGYTTDTGEIIAVDLGKFSVTTPYRMRRNDVLSSLYITLETKNPSGEDIEIYDIVLMPTDEWTGSFSTTATGVSTASAYSGKRYDIDGITHPRASRTTLTHIIDDNNQTLDAELMQIMSSAPILQANKDQRLWFTQMYDVENYVHFESVAKVRLQRSSRYLLARGSR